MLRLGLTTKVDGLTMIRTIFCRLLSPSRRSWQSPSRDLEAEGFVSVFITGELLPIFVGYAFALAGLTLIAPTRAEIEKRERSLQTAGVQGSFIRAVKEAKIRRRA